MRYILAHNYVTCDVKVDFQRLLWELGRNLNNFVCIIKKNHQNILHNFQPISNLNTTFSYYKNHNCGSYSHAYIINIDTVSGFIFNLSDILIRWDSSSFFGTKHIL